MRTDEGWPISEGVLWYLQSRLTTVASIYFHMHSVPAAIRALLLTPRQEASKLCSPRYRLQISQYPLTYIGRPSDFIGAIEVSGLGVGGSAHQQAPSKHRRLRYRLSDIYILPSGSYVVAGFEDCILKKFKIVFFLGDFGLFGRKLYLNEF